MGKINVVLANGAISLCPNAETFLASADTRLERISLFAGDGFGIISGSNVALALCDPGRQDAAVPSSYSAYSAEANLFGSGQGLPIFWRPTTKNTCPDGAACSNRPVMADRANQFDSAMAVYGAGLSNENSKN
jgi:hypothetical protein